jgi:oxygen-dependent protoporphyrinogen oxidase
MSHTDRWIIVGGGASGLAAAFFLKQRGICSEIVERESSVGGRMSSVELGGRMLDCGGKNIGRQYKLFRQFAASLGDHPFEYFGLNSSQIVDGKLTTFDATARWQSFADVARGVSWRDAVRFAGILARMKAREGNGYLGSAYSRTMARRYDRLPVSSYFSDEFCRRIIRPMTVRMNGAEPDEVYVGNLASNARMLLDTYEQFKHGMAPLLNSFVNCYPVHLNTSTEALLVTGRRVTGVRVRYADGRTAELHGAGVILATPSPVAADLVEPVLPAAAERLRSIRYYPVGLVLAEYQKPVFTADVRALVFDPAYACSNAGAYGVNDRHIVRYTFSGRTARRHLESRNAESLLILGEAALARHIPFDPRSRLRFAAKRFAQGLCAYTSHHAAFVGDLHRDLSKTAGLYLTGDYMQGASIEACFRAASACVNQLARVEPAGLPVRGSALEPQPQL